MLPRNASVCVLRSLTYDAIKKKTTPTTAELKGSHRSVNGNIAVTGKTIVLFHCKPKYVYSESLLYQ